MDYHLLMADRVLAELAAGQVPMAALVQIIQVVAAAADYIVPVQTSLVQVGQVLLLLDIEIFKKYATI
jgi:hypothetical protein